MALGPGKYDADLTRALTLAAEREPEIEGGVLIIVGPEGSAGAGGFSVQLKRQALFAMPGVLRQVADQMEADLAAIAAGAPLVRTPDPERSS